MTIRKTLAALSVFGLAIGMALPAAAKVTWTGSLTGTSDYKFRSISQTDNDAAIQGSFELGYEGFIAGIWASSVDFATDPGADVEVDLYLGYKHDFNETTSITGKVVYYLYPDANTPDADYFELMAALNHDFGKFTGNLQIAYTPDYFGGTDSAVWLGAGLGLPINDWLSISGNVGVQYFDNNFGPAPNVGLPDYVHGDIGLTATWDIVSLDLRYVVNDLDDADCFGGTDLCDNRLVLTATITTGSED